MNICFRAVAVLHTLQQLKYGDGDKIVLRQFVTEVQHTYESYGYDWAFAFYGIILLVVGLFASICLDILHNGSLEHPRQDEKIVSRD